MSSIKQILLTIILQLNLATNLGLVCFCWGDENNSKDTIKFLKSLNIHGIIYDKMDKLTEKNVKVSQSRLHSDSNGVKILELDIDLIYGV